MSNDYHITLKVRHGQLHAAMAATGIKSVAELSRVSGVSAGIIYDLMNLKRSAKVSPEHYGEQGFGPDEWRPAVLKLCKALSMEPSWLFPEHIKEVPCNTMTAYAEQSQIEALAGTRSSEPLHLMPPDMAMDAKMKSDLLASALGELTDRERQVIECRILEGKTRKETECLLGVTRSRINRLEKRALMKLRRPCMPHESPRAILAREYRKDT